MGDGPLVYELLFLPVKEIGELLAPGEHLVRHLLLHLHAILLRVGAVVLAQANLTLPVEQQEVVNLCGSASGGPRSEGRDPHHLWSVSINGRYVTERFAWPRACVCGSARVPRALVALPELGQLTKRGAAGGKKTKCLCINSKRLGARHTGSHACHSAPSWAVSSVRPCRATRRTSVMRPLRDQQAHPRCWR